MPIYKYDTPRRLYCLNVGIIMTLDDRVQQSKTQVVDNTWNVTAFVPPVVMVIDTAMMIVNARGRGCNRWITR